MSQDVNGLNIVNTWIMQESSSIPRNLSVSFKCWRKIRYVCSLL